MANVINLERRRFLRSSAMALAAGGFGVLSTAEAGDRESPELAAIGRATAWINSVPLTPSNLLGKIVAVDFWTYTSINWLRTLPFLRAWAQEHGKQLVVLGVHTPEFPFEHSVENVRHAVQSMNIPYPVVIDNDYAIWRAFENRSWPTLCVLDGRGRIRQRHAGEGEYEQSERCIQRLLSEANIATVTNDIGSIEGVGVEAAADWAHLRSPKTCMGYGQGEKFATRGAGSTIPRTYVAPARLALNQWALAGRWTKSPQSAFLSSDAGHISYRFHARDVHLVMGPTWPWPSVRFRVRVDGRPPGQAHGLDIDESGDGVATEQRLYQLIRQPQPIVDRTVTIEFLDPGIEAFSFTFG